MPPARLARYVPVVPVVLTVLTGCSPAPGTAPDDPATGSGARDRTAVGTHSPGDRAAVGRPAAPVEVRIPSIGVRSSLLELGLNTDGTVEVPPPDKGMTAGWYTGGAAPGEAGAAVIIGHNDTRFGKAVFHDLRKVAKGADVVVRNSLGESMRFTVTGSESVSKDSFPTDKVYGPTRDHALRLITCDGDFDAEGHPVNNLIVYATLD
ncbi:class F sortase [Streptomyces camponoticapitis]|uniref:class F sortase n=1 Tax=Streptomyces camponoticapitis TaxID=1616125 RepID=UPI00166A286A|nr:class F sortase [Streptomyces camponoticapitis]